MRLIASTPPSSHPQLINILPAVLTDVPENISRSANVSLGNVVAQVKLIAYFHVAYSCSLCLIGEHACWCPSK
jgi:hypothetical protein